MQRPDFCSWLSRAESESEREKEGERGRERERERENEAQLESTSPLSLGLSLSFSLTLSRLAIRKHDNRWEPPPGSAWECSGIIASGTPSTIKQRTHRHREVGWKLERPGSDWQPWHTNMGTGEKGWVATNASPGSHPGHLLLQILHILHVDVPELLLAPASFLSSLWSYAEQLYILCNHSDHTEVFFLICNKNAQLKCMQE